MALQSDKLVKTWQRMRRFPGGRLLFSRMIGKFVPYTDSIKATVMELEPGRARVELKDRRAVRNHLRSIHAIALMNLGEMTSGLAFMSAMPPDSRSILTSLSIEFKKKARGTLSSECDLREQIPKTTEKQEKIFQVDIKNLDGEVVAVAKAQWLIGPAQ